MTQMGLLIFLYNYNLLHFFRDTHHSRHLNDRAASGHPERRPCHAAEIITTFWCMKDRSPLGVETETFGFFGVYLGCRRETVRVAVFEVFWPFSSLSVPPCLRPILGNDSCPRKVFLCVRVSAGIVVIGQSEPPISVSRTRFLLHEPLPERSGTLPVRSSHRQLHVKRGNNTVLRGNVTGVKRRSWKWI